MKTLAEKLELFGNLIDSENRYTVAERCLKNADYAELYCHSRKSDFIKVRRDLYTAMSLAEDVRDFYSRTCFKFHTYICLNDTPLYTGEDPYDYFSRIGETSYEASSLNGVVVKTQIQLLGYIMAMYYS